MTHVAYHKGRETARVKAQHKLGLQHWRVPLSPEEIDWVDAIDPSLPADPSVGQSTVEKQRPLIAHKLVLCGVGIAAGAMAMGYLGAAWALS